MWVMVLGACPHMRVMMLGAWDTLPGLVTVGHSHVLCTHGGGGAAQSRMNEIVDELTAMLAGVARYLVRQRCCCSLLVMCFCRPFRSPFP